MASLPPVDISYYITKQELESLGSLDVPLSNGEIVSINLVEELPDDPNELIGFLETESCPSKYWISVAQGYANVNKLDDSLKVIEQAINKFPAPQDSKLLAHFKFWLYLKFIHIGVNKSSYISKLDEEINDMMYDDDEELVPVLSLKAVYSLLKNKDVDALRYFDRLLNIDETNCFALLGRAQILLRKGSNYNAALRIYQQVLVINPSMKPDPRLGIGLCFWHLKDHKMALTSWNRCLELDPNNSKAKILINLYNFNNTFNNSLSDEEFLENYKACLEQLNENMKLSNNKDPINLLVLASYYFSKQNYNLVEKIVNKIIGDISSESAATGNTKFSKYQFNLLSQSSYWLGRCYFNQSDFTQSQRCFHESIKFDENNFASRLGLGLSQISRNLKQEAMITFEQLYKLNSRNLEVNYCLGLLNSQLKSRRRNELAIQFLERYINLSNNRGVENDNSSDHESILLNKEPINLNAFLILSKLYENKDINQSLNYLNKAVESRSQIEKDVPVEVYNNIGVFNFMKANNDLANENFQLALDGLSKVSNEQLKEDLKITLTFNLARSKEEKEQDESIKLYQEILDKCPNYFSAKLRILFLKLVSDKVDKKEIKEEIDDLLESQTSNLEVRSFYGWFVKTFGKKLGVKPDADTNHQKETLVKYDSHDCYALISLANIYCVMAREAKGSSNEDKRKKYYIRAIELFAKVLSTDSKNVYAAQGLAIVYIENKEMNKGLDILRKIRDSLNYISIYLNLGHVLLELKQYNKAIENYEIALKKFTNGKDSNILALLSKSWLLRGNSEKNLSYLKRGLEYSKQALENSNEAQKNNLKFNISFVEYQLADFVIKLPIQERTIEGIEETIGYLTEGISILNELAESGDEKRLPYSKNDLKSRANLGNTLSNRLNNVLTETKDYNSKISEKLQEAQKIREDEIKEKLRQEEERQLKLQLLEQEKEKERERLQEQAKIWAEENRAIDDEENDDKLFNEESEKQDKKTKGKSTGKGKKGAKGKGKKKDFVNDSEEESNTDVSEPEPEPELSGNEDNEESESKKKRKKNVIEDDGDEDEETNNSKSKKKFKSAETIEDSDEGLSGEDGLF